MSYRIHVEKQNSEFTRKLKRILRIKEQHKPEQKKIENKQNCTTIQQKNFLK